MFHVEKITKKSPDKRQLKRLFISAFPKEERPPFFVIWKRRNRCGVDFLVAREGEKHIGFAYCVSKNSSVYLFFLAVEEKERGKGYGSKILSFLKERYKGKSIFLAMEEMDERAKNYGERVKRQRFYQKNGLHPIPLKIQEGTVIYDVCASGEVNREDYTLMMEEYLGRKKCQKLPIKMYEE